MVQSNLCLHLWRLWWALFQRGLRRWTTQPFTQVHIAQTAMQRKATQNRMKWCGKTPPRSPELKVPDLVHQLMPQPQVIGYLRPIKLETG